MFFFHPCILFSLNRAVLSNCPKKWLKCFHLELAPFPLFYYFRAFYHFFVGIFLSQFILSLCCLCAAVIIIFSLNSVRLFIYLWNCFCSAVQSISWIYKNLVELAMTIIVWHAAFTHTLVHAHTSLSPIHSFLRIECMYLFIKWSRTINRQMEYEQWKITITKKNIDFHLNPLHSKLIGIQIY